ncbi:unnamed protein product [Chilo suppressalis]|uniref:Corticotropin-releasing factor-like protein n=1 Tax=Chilo suppressalis TaxID=168631 RepID=A0A0S1U0H5_CHISP|nr:corticotropin-releasing factor-like protein [Chilo suppressalis]CAH2990111.1 unnamed protein product [Chilo suppressalis]
MMWWAVWCAVVAAGAGAASAPAPDSLAPLDLVQMDSPAPEDEGINYGVPPMGSRYASGAPWLYLLAEMPRESQVSRSVSPMRPRRSFTVNPAVDVLQRSAYNSYLERLAHNNRNFLDRLGKRAPAHFTVLSN